MLDFMRDFTELEAFIEQVARDRPQTLSGADLAAVRPNPWVFRRGSGSQTHIRMKLGDLWYARRQGESIWHRADRGTEFDIEAAWDETPARWLEGARTRQSLGPPGGVDGGTPAWCATVWMSSHATKRATCNPRRVCAPRRALWISPKTGLAVASIEPDRQ